MKKQGKAIKKSLAAVLAGVMVMGTSITCLAANGGANDAKLFIEFGDLNNDIIRTPFNYHGVECYYIKPGENEFKFAKEKSSISDIANLDYNVNILIFDENKQEWNWCELGGDMTYGDFEYDKVFKMIIPEATKTGFVEWTYDFSKGEDMTKFTDAQVKAYADENGYTYSGGTPDWVVHIYVNDGYNGKATPQWDWYFKPSLNASSLTQSVDTGSSAAQTTWMNDANGWWVVRPDGSYITNAWYQSPESGLWYYMGSNGYMLVNTTTPDGYRVNEAGVWVQ